MGAVHPSICLVSYLECHQGGLVIHEIRDAIGDLFSLVEQHDEVANST